MQKLISKYGLAAHLGLTTAAPLFLFPYLGADALGVTMLWLSAVAWVWTIMEPSRIGSEMPHQARERVVRTLVRDPLFYFLVFAVAFAAVRALNHGIGMRYDFEVRHWAFREAPAPLLPGCVDGHGFAPFCMLAAMLPVVMGIRHALGKSARIAYAVTVASVVGLGGIVAALQFLNGSAGIVVWMQCDYFNPAFVGMGFGVALLLGVVGIFGANERRWLRAEFMVALGLVGTALGLVMFSSIVGTLVFAAAALVLIIAGFVAQRSVFEGVGSFRCGMVFITMLVATGIFTVMCDPDSGVAERYAALIDLRLLPEKFAAMQRILSSVAAKVFLEKPWLGSGLGSFQVDLRFFASPADLRTLIPAQTSSLQAWWQLIAERGTIGAAMFAVAFGFLCWTYVSRLVFSFHDLEFRALNFLFPVLTLAAVAVSFFECSLLRSETVLILVSALALSGNGAPARKKAEEPKES